MLQFPEGVRILLLNRNGPWGCTVSYSRRDKNIIHCQGWSFAFDEESRHVSRWVVIPNEAITITGDIVNDGLMLGTVYVRAQISRSHLAPAAYFDGGSMFDTHRDLNAGAKSAQRVVDIEIGGRSPWSVDWIVPYDLHPGHFDFQIEVWNPPKLFDTPGPYMFHRTDSFGGFEVVEPKILSPRLQSFISYSHDSVEHARWTMRLVDELMRHGIPAILDDKDAEIGGLFDKYMAEGIARAPVILMICSQRYVARADAYEGGVGFEMRRIETLLKENPNAILVVPVVRNNPENRLPAAIGNIKGVDMRGDDWLRQPLQDLVRVIKSKSDALPKNPSSWTGDLLSWLRSR